MIIMIRIWGKINDKMEVYTTAELMKDFSLHDQIKRFKHWRDIKIQNKKNKENYWIKWKGRMVRHVRFLCRPSRVDLGEQVVWPLMVSNGLQWSSMLSNVDQWSAMVCNVLQWSGLFCSGLVKSLWFNIIEVRGLANSIKLNFGFKTTPGTRNSWCNHDDEPCLLDNV